MKIYKKSDIEFQTLLIVIILLCFAVAFAYVIWKSGGPMAVWLDKIFDWV